MSRKGPISRSSLPPYGIDPIQAEGRLPWILTVPKEPYYEGVEWVFFVFFWISIDCFGYLIRQARQYLPISLRTLQRLIDLRRINPEKPIDLPVLCNTKLFSIQPDQRQFGLQLTDEVKHFLFKLNIFLYHSFRVLIYFQLQLISKFNGYPANYL